MSPIVEDDDGSQSAEIHVDVDSDWTKPYQRFPVKMAAVATMEEKIVNAFMYVFYFSSKLKILKSYKLLEYHSISINYIIHFFQPVSIFAILSALISSYM